MPDQTDDLATFAWMLLAFAFVSLVGFMLGARASRGGADAAVPLGALLVSLFAAGGLYSGSISRMAWPLYAVVPLWAVVTLAAWKGLVLCARVGRQKRREVDAETKAIGAVAGTAADAAGLLSGGCGCVTVAGLLVVALLAAMLAG